MTMDKILDGLRTDIIWSDNIGIDANAIMPMDSNNIMNQAKTSSTVSIMDLGKMLLVCAKDGDTSKVHELMSRGAPFTTDWLGTSPLHMAAMNNHLETCEVLLRAGISKDARTKVDRTPLHFAVYEGHEAIVELLLKYKCDVNARDMLKMTSLHWAIEKRFPKLVTLLLKHGADPSAMSKFDKSPITLSLETKQNDIFQELISTNTVTISEQEQEEATASLMYEMEKDNYEPHNQTEIEADVVLDSPENSPQSAKQSHIAKVLPNNQKHQTIRTEDSPTLQILKKHGISMLPDDADNTIINSALQSGRKLILSDAGKQLILNYPKTMKTGTSSSGMTTIPTHTDFMKSDNGAMKRKSPAVVMPNMQSKTSGALKTNKVIKILSAEEFNKMCAGKMPNNAFKKLPADALTSNGSGFRFETLQSNLAHLAKVNNNKRAIMNKGKINTVPALVSNQQRANEIKLAPISSLAMKSVNNVQRMPKLCPNVVVNSTPNASPNHDSTTTAAAVTNNAQKKMFYKLEQSQLTTSASSITPSNSIASAIANTSLSSNAAAAAVVVAAATTTTVATTSGAIQKTSSSPSSNLITISRTSFNDIMRQLYDVKKQTEDLRKQMDLYQKQNEDYRIRLEKLEKERDGDREDSTRQYTNSNY